jgi:hypothetical protein
MSQSNALADLRNHLYHAAEIKWAWSLGLAFAALLLSIVGVTSKTASFIEFTGAAALMLPVVIAWLREIASSEILRADKCRRLVLYSDGLGQVISPAQLADVRAWGLGTDVRPAQFVGSYYASKHTPGPQRLADITTESAFFTKALAGKLQFALWILFAVALFLAGFALLLADFAKGFATDQLVSAAKAIGVFVGFLISGDFALLAKKYGDLNKAAELAFHQSEQLREQGNPSGDVVRTIADDYGIALLQCPPIPSWLFRRYQSALNKAYQDSHGPG